MECTRCAIFSIDPRRRDDLSKFASTSTAKCPTCVLGATRATKVCWSGRGRLSRINAHRGLAGIVSRHIESRCRRAVPGLLLLLLLMLPLVLLLVGQFTGVVPDEQRVGAREATTHRSGGRCISQPGKDKRGAFTAAIARVLLIAPNFKQRAGKPHQRTRWASDGLVFGLPEVVCGL